MAKKKNKPKKMANTPKYKSSLKKNSKPKKMAASPIQKSSLQKGNKPNLAAKILRPRALSTLAFGISGLLAGLATGLNHFPSFAQAAVVPKMMLLAAYLGDPHLDVVAGLLTGFAGLVMGACLGFSALSDPKDMGLSLILSIVCATAAIVFTGNVAIGALGFLAGHTPAIMAYMRLRRA